MTRPGSTQSAISGRGAPNLGFPFRRTRSTSRVSLTTQWSSSTLGEIGPRGNAHRREVRPRLRDRTWLVGDYPLADICYAPVVTVLDRVRLGRSRERAASRVRLGRAPSGPDLRSATRAAADSAVA